MLLCSKVNCIWNSNGHQCKRSEVNEIISTSNNAYYCTNGIIKNAEGEKIYPNYNFIQCDFKEITNQIVDKEVEEILGN